MQEDVIITGNLQTGVPIAGSTTTGVVITANSVQGPTLQGTVTTGGKGAKGDPGNDGYTPVKGVDYNDGADGADGADGREIELQSTATHIQWRYLGETWDDLIPLAELRGEDGSDGVAVELQKTATHVQWRLVGGTWANLIALVDLKGDKGDTGDTGATGPANSLSIGTVSEGSAAATITGTAPTQTLNLTLPKGNTGATGPANSLSIGTVTEGAAAATITGTAPSQTLNLTIPKGNTGATGAPGADGDDGREVELNKSATHIQWRYVGDVSWLDLVALTDLKGADGADGTDGDDGNGILSGSGAPASGLGVNGDFYIDTSVPALYGPKTGGSWGSATSLVGPSGAGSGDMLASVYDPANGARQVAFADELGTGDHGGLTGLADDDHTQYALADGSRGSFAATSHTHVATTDLTATGTKSSSTYLRGDNTWATPTNTTYSEISEAEITAGTASTARTISGRRSEFIVNKARARANHTGTQTASTISDFDTEVSNNTDVAANTAARHTHSNSSVLDATTASFTIADETKLDGIEAGAEVNEVSATDLAAKVTGPGSASADNILSFDGTTGKIAKDSGISATTLASQISDIYASMVTATSTTTLTNKRIQPRVSSTASTANLTPAIGAADIYVVTALAETMTFQAPTGGQEQGEKLMFRIKDNGTARTLNWSGAYRAIGVTLPTTTTANKTLYIGAVFNATDTLWDVIALSEES